MKMPADSAAMAAELLSSRRIIAEMGRDAAMLRAANQHLVLASVEAQNLREAAEQANHRQNEFLAMLAHELRNPLAPISLANAMLARLPDPSPALLNLQGIIGRQLAHLTRLLDDLLDAARINSGKIALLRGPLALDELLRRSVQTVQSSMNDRRQLLELELENDMVVDADPVRLAQVFANLLVNASKYTGDGGTVDVTARRVDGQAVVSVRDNGAGISAEVLPHIFDLFTQGPRPLARADGGLGVGLNVVRNIVQLHGGAVEAASAGLGAGTVVSVSLPLSAARVPPQLVNREGAAPACRRILVVEDNHDANDTLGRLLAGDGHRVQSAYDGTTGLHMAQARDVDVLICDIGLPGLDGFELLTRLRASPGAHLPFAIAISGYGRTEDRVRAASAGFGQYFVKPVDVDALLALIASDAVDSFIAAARAG